MTRKLYYEDSHQKSCAAQVLECSSAGSDWEIVLDQTVFFPEGGGQPCDKGRIGTHPVLRVREKAGIIYHRIEHPLDPGTPVECEIDWPYRFSLMQNHSGEHIVSGLIHAQYGYDNVGFHMGSERVTLDINGVLSKEELREIERKANQAVWANLPVQTEFPAQEELKRLSYRSKLELDKDVRIVQIGELDHCACCAPHVRSTGEIGLIRLLAHQSYKGGVRISMLCGERALEQCFCVQDQIEAMGVQFSVKQEEVLEAVKKLFNAYEELLGVKNQLSTELLKRRAAEYPMAHELRWIFTSEEGEELRIYANFLSERNQGITALFSGEDRKGYRYILVSAEEDVRILNQAIRENLKAKGGGSARMAQGSLPASQMEITSFLEKYRTKI